MFDEETLGKVREAFHQVQRDCDLHGWELDDKLVSPFLQESGSARLTVSLLRGAAERTSVVIDPAAVRQREGGLTVSNLAEEVKRVLRESAILSD